MLNKWCTDLGFPNPLGSAGAIIANASFRCHFKHESTPVAVCSVPVCRFYCGCSQSPKSKFHWRRRPLPWPRLAVVLACMSSACVCCAQSSPPAFPKCILVPFKWSLDAFTSVRRTLALTFSSLTHIGILGHVVGIVTSWGVLSRDYFSLPEPPVHGLLTPF